MDYIRVSGEEETHMENIEMPSEQTETDFREGSIPDEIESAENESQVVEEIHYKTEDLRNQVNLDSSEWFHVGQHTIELSKQAESIDFQSIFYSETDGSASKVTDSKNTIERWRELNDMAVDLIKQGIKIQEGEDSEAEGELDEDDDDRQNRAHELFNTALNYLKAWVGYMDNAPNLFESTIVQTIHYNIAWILQKTSDLQQWAKHLDVVLKLFKNHKESSLSSDLIKSKTIVKFELQQWAIKSQNNDHLEAIEHGKNSVKQCHSLIYKTYKLCK